MFLLILWQVDVAVAVIVSSSSIAPVILMPILLLLVCCWTVLAMLRIREPQCILLSGSAGYW